MVDAHRLRVSRSLRDTAPSLQVFCARTAKRRFPCAQGIPLFRCAGQGLAQGLCQPRLIVRFAQRPHARCFRRSSDVNASRVYPEVESTAKCGRRCAPIRAANRHQPQARACLALPRRPARPDRPITRVSLPSAIVVRIDASAFRKTNLSISGRSLPSHPRWFPDVGTKKSPVAGALFLHLGGEGGIRTHGRGKPYA